jgi:hypothetical protein
LTSLNVEAFEVEELQGAVVALLDSVEAMIDHSEQTAHFHLSHNVLHFEKNCLGLVQIGNCSGKVRGMNATASDEVTLSVEKKRLALNEQRDMRQLRTNRVQQR